MTGWGLVLGGGGVLGAAWTVGALAALQEVTGLDARHADVLVGTSAGAVTAGLLGYGVSVPELHDHQVSVVRTGPLAGVDWEHDSATGGTRPPLPRLGLGSPPLVYQGAATWRQRPPTAVLSALLPEGRGRLESVGRLLSDVATRAGAASDGWSPHPGVRAVAMDYDTGRRVAFGDPQAPRAGLAEAVMASCAIPGWYSPVQIQGRRYIDGGAASATNIDLLAGAGLDHVYALVPMASFVLDRPGSLAGRLERAWRERVTRRALREVAKVHATGTEVTVLGPGREDLEAIGANLMDVRRRRVVLETALRTTRAELTDPELLTALIRAAGTDDRRGSTTRVGAGQ